MFTIDAHTPAENTLFVLSFFCRSENWFLNGRRRDGDYFLQHLLLININLGSEGNYEDVGRDALYFLNGVSEFKD